MTYDDKKFEKYRGLLREHLVKEQRYLCAYCCCEIDENNSHNEHIEPRHPKCGVSKKSLDYDNLVASCYGFSGEKTCGPSKENEYDETQFVSPLDLHCEDIFSYYPNGHMEGDEYTIDLLNSNSYKLRQAREAVFRTIMYMSKEDIELIYGGDEEKMQPFSNVIRWYLRNV